MSDYEQNSNMNTLFIRLPHIILLLFLYAVLQVNAIVLAGDKKPGLTPQESRWLKENTIRYAPNPSWPPLDYTENGEHTGLLSEYIAIIEKQLGVTFERVYYNNWNEILNGLQSGEVDFVGAIQQTPERDDFLLFTDEFITIPVFILTQNNYPFQLTRERLTDMSIGGVTGYESVNYIRKTYPGVRVHEFDDDLSALIQTSLGNVDAAVADLAVASYLIQKYGITRLNFGKKLDFEWEIRMGTRKDAPELVSILNKTIGSIDTESRKKLLSNWVSADMVRERNFFERNYQRLLIISIVVVLVTGVVSLYNYELRKKIRERTRDLRLQIREKITHEHRLEKSLKEREILLSEIHHRVKNNLAIVTAMLQIEAMNIEDETIQHALSNSIMRIRSMAMIHEQLYSNGDFKFIQIQTYVTELVGSIEELYGKKSRIRIEKEIDAIQMNINIAIPCALVINELVTNAYEHAFPDGRNGTIGIRFRKIDDTLHLVIEDDGIGMPEDTVKAGNSSVGLMLVDVLASQLEADYAVETKPGTTFSFSFKNQDKKGSAATLFPKANEPVHA
jgi:two-component sensor histidine kinase/ABC-type amino acid transport substrate-binding protein